MNGDMAILRCGQCKKPFDKQSSLQRHGYYCRSRRGAQTPRLRACEICVRRKVRCDNGQPSCSRCRERDIACRYPTGTSVAKETSQIGLGSVRQHDSAASSSIMLQNALATEATASSGNGTLFPLVDIQHVTALQDESYDGAGSYSDQAALSIPGPNLVELPPSTTFPPPIASSSTSVARLQMDQAMKNRQENTAVATFLATMSSSSPTPLLLYSARSMIQRPRLGPGEQKAVDLIFHAVRSYSVMMLRDKTLPPFIHPHLLSTEIGLGTGAIGPGSMETLTDCIALINMTSTSTQGSRKLFWKNVKLECERLCLEYETFDRWKLLAAMQALSLYTLIRLHEGEQEYNNVDFLLISAVILVGQQLVFVDRRLSPFEKRPCWENWIYQESRRRLGVLYRILNILVYFEPIDICYLQSDLAIAPLPAKKRLWEAEHALQWEGEMAKARGVQADYGLAANGNLVRMYAGQDYCLDGTKLLYERDESSIGVTSSQRFLNAWDEWCSGMDEFGGLVMLAAVVVA